MDWRHTKEMRFRRKSSSYGLKAKRRTGRPETAWTEKEIKRILSNPFYCGVRVDSILTLERPIEEGYIQTATQIIHEVGAEAYLRNFLERLQDASRPLPDGTSITDDHLLSAIKVHPYFAEEHPALVTVEEFVKAGVISIEHSAEEYLRDLLENLRGNWV